MKITDDIEKIKKVFLFDAITAVAYTELVPPKRVKRLIAFAEDATAALKFYATKPHSMSELRRIGVQDGGDKARAVLQKFGLSEDK